MARTNKKVKSSLMDPVARTGGGMRAARQNAPALLRRSVLTCLLWEDNAYCDGETVVQTIRDLIPQVPPATVAALAVEARHEQKLRHVPLLIVREMARHPSHKHLVADTLEKIIRRADELAEFVALYWSDNGGRKTLSAQVKKGLARAFSKFDEYQLAKWDKSDAQVKLRDVLFLCHAKPKSEVKLPRTTKTERKAGLDRRLTDHEDLYARLIAGQLATPDTWEVGLSAAKSDTEKREVWERLLDEGNLGSYAFMKNLRNMQQVGVSPAAIRHGFKTIKADMLLPIDFLKARQYAPDYSRDIEGMMLRCAASWPKLTGHSVFVVDVSGSMGHAMSSKSEFTRMSAAAAMTILASEMCEHITIYATAGNDGSRQHKTEKIEALRGFALSDAILERDCRKSKSLGGGGIFTRQCLEYIKTQEKEQPDRIIVFSDSQDCDRENKIPKPFGKKNYIVDVSCEKHGVNYAGIWTAELSGWSESFLRFIAESEHIGSEVDEW